MIRRFLREGTTAADVTSTSPVGVLAPGGGYQAWTERHPACRLLFDYVAVVYALQLPYHGPLSSLPYHRTPAEVSASIDAVRVLLSPLVRGRYCVYFGYSMGSLFLLKLLPHLPSHPSSPLIAIGSTLTLTRSAPGIADWWTSLAVTDAPRLTRLHGSTFPTTIAFIIDTCADTGSRLLMGREEREEVVRRREVFWVAGNEDAAFPLEELREAMTEAMGKECGGGGEREGDAEGEAEEKRERRRRVWVVPSDHHAYFNKETWPRVREAMVDIMQRHAKPELLQPRRDAVHAQPLVPSSL